MSRRSGFSIEGRSMNTGWDPLNWILNADASFNEKPARSSFSWSASVSNAASAIMEKDHSYG